MFGVFLHATVYRVNNFHQGCRKLFTAGRGGRIARKGHPERAEVANRGQRGQIVQNGHFAMFVIVSFFVNFGKTYKNQYTLAPLGKG